MAQPESQFFKLTLKLELMFNFLMLSYRYKIIVDDLSLTHLTYDYDFSPFSL